MELVSYKEFGRLRLGPFCPYDDLYEEDTDGRVLRAPVRRLIRFDLCPHIKCGGPPK